MNYETPKQLEGVITERVMKDLNPSWISVQTRVGISTILGGILSLLVCGQFGIGITTFADILNDKIHHNLGPISCALICGSMYAVFPTLILRLFFTSALQFKVITHQRFLSVLAWFAGFGVVLIYFGHHGDGLLSLGFWTISVISATNIIAKIFNKILPRWSFGSREKPFLHKRKEW